MTAAEAQDGCRALVVEVPARSKAQRTPEPLYRRLTESHLITVALVDGAVTGWGLGLAAACDHVIVDSAGGFDLEQETLADYLPYLARRMGARGAWAFLLSGHADAAAAAASGLADEQAEDLQAALRKLLIDLRRTEPAAIRRLKQYYRTLYPIPTLAEDLR
ncbi:enoyl-CoA hydratase-related protein [Streptomyces sp. NPDC001139]